MKLSCLRIAPLQPITWWDVLCQMRSHVLRCDTGMQPMRNLVAAPERPPSRCHLFTCRMAMNSLVQRFVSP